MAPAYDCLILDCDGVILDANAMKTAAFAAVLAAFPAPAVEAFLAYQRQTFGRSRFRLLQDFFDRFHPHPVTTAEQEGLLARFGARCHAEYLRVPLTEGAKGFLCAAAARHRLYVASGSAQEELRAVFAERGLGRYFVDVLGSPTPKAELLAQIVAREPGRRALMLGDASADWDAARSAGLDFVLVARYSNERATLLPRIEAAGVVSVETLAELTPRLGSPHFPARGE